MATLLVDPITDRANWSARGIVLRELDARECWAGGLSSSHALENSVRLSDYAAEVWSSHELVGVWGWLAMTPTAARVWLLTTDAIGPNARAFLRTSAALCARLRTTHPHLSVLCHNDHQPARRWLSWLGFHPQEEIGEFTVWAT